MLITCCETLLLLLLPVSVASVGFPSKPDSCSFVLEALKLHGLKCCPHVVSFSAMMSGFIHRLNTDTDVPSETMPRLVIRAVEPPMKGDESG